MLIKRSHFTLGLQKYLTHPATDFKVRPGLRRHIAFVEITSSGICICKYAYLAALFSMNGQTGHFPSGYLQGEPARPLCTHAPNLHKFANGATRCSGFFSRGQKNGLKLLYAYTLHSVCLEALCIVLIPLSHHRDVVAQQGCGGSVQGCGGSVG
jgi:hypothetical protein